QWYYYGFRYYDPMIGRWPSRDPVAEYAGLNLYRMAENALVQRWDFLGMWTIEGVWKILCCTEEGREVVEGLASLSVFSVDQSIEVWNVNGQEVEEDGGVEGFVKELGGDEFYVRASLSDESAAQVLVHELVHANQDPEMDAIDSEVEAYSQDTEFA